MKAPQASGMGEQGHDESVPDASQPVHPSSTVTNEYAQRFATNPLAAELCLLPQWVPFRKESRGGKMTKVPYRPSVKSYVKAKSNDPGTWGAHEDAIHAAEHGKYDGVGFVFTADDPYLGIDIDKCRNQKTGALNGLGQYVLDQFKSDSYTDVSPSGTGIHIITRAVTDKAHRYSLPGCGVEVYSSGRFFTMTGEPLGQFSGAASIGDGSDALQKLLPLLEVIHKANKKTEFVLLYENSEESDSSSGDLSFINYLRHAGATREQADQLYRLSGRFRDKWDERHSSEGHTYGEMTLDKSYGAGNSEPPSLGGYTYENNETSLIKTTKEGMVKVPLSNFVARIDEEMTHDDGFEIRKLLKITVTLRNGQKYDCVVSANEFAAMNWVMEKCGPEAVMQAGNGIKDHVRASIQSYSAERGISKQQVLAYTGWTQLNGQPAYLTASGAITAKGLRTDVAVDLEGLARFTVATPPEQDQLKHDVEALRNFLEVGPPQITLVLLAAVFAPVLMETPFSLFLLGRTGVGKTQLAALWQAFWGASLNATTLPGNWSSTANSLEALASAAKDTGLVVDDLAPEGSEADVRRTLANANRLLRSQGNKQGRGRMRADTSQRPQRYPRGLLLVTGEDLPRMGSIVARSVIMELRRGQTNWDRLTQAQKDAADGCFARILAYVIQEIARDYEELRGQANERALELRSEMTAPHARSVDAAASLQAALEIGLPLLGKAGAFTEAEVSQLTSQGLRMMSEVAAGQRQFQQTSDPVHRFAELLSTVLLRGQAHLTNREGSAPDDAERYGWKLNQRGDEGVYQARGNRMGAVLNEGQGSEVWFLIADAAYAEVQKLAREQGEPFQFSQAAIWRLLGEAGYLERKENSTWRAKATIAGQRINGYSFRPNHNVTE